MSKIEIAPSIIASDFANIEKEVRKVEDAGINFLHFDIMDGHFVPNITIGPGFVKSIRKITSLQFDVHLMITEPQKYIDAFLDSGADWISFHIEAYDFPLRIITAVKDKNKKVGIVLNPSTNIDTIENLLEYLDYVLLMSVDPGFSGQRFIPFTLKKIEKLKKIIVKNNYNTIIEVDGGVNENTIGSIINAGADMLVMGYAFFKNENYMELVKQYKK